MSLIGIVAISALSALFFFALLAGLVCLIWLAFRMRKDLQAMKDANTSVLTATQRQLESVYAETQKLIVALEVKIDGQQKESALLQAKHEQDLAVSMNTFKADISAAIAKINAEALQTVAVRLTQVSIRAEKAISVFQQLILDTEKSTANEYGPEEFAPEENRFSGPPSAYGLSQTAKMDAETDMVEQASQFTESPAEV